MLEEGIFDIHCHIVPGVDDGAADIEETRKLLEMEYKQGVKNIILTPHFRFRMFETPLEKVQRQFHLAEEAAADISKDLHLYLGCEFHANMEMLPMLREKKVSTMAGSRYVLVEFKSKKNNHDRNQYRQTDHHEAIVSREIYNAAQKMLDASKYMKKGYPLPTLQVVDQGALKGFVPVNRAWNGFSSADYEKASLSAYSENNNEICAEKTENRGFDLSGYEIVRAQFFSTRFDPAVTISSGKIVFNTACLKKFEDVEYVELLFNSVEKCIAVRPCERSSINAIKWGTIRDGRWAVLPKSCKGFSEPLYELMGWNKDCKYKLRGQFCGTADEQVMIFELEEPEVLVREKAEEQFAEETEKKPEDAQKPIKKILYPEAWAYNFGESTNRTVFLQRVAYRGNWDILRPARTVEGMEIITREVLDDLLESAEKLIDKMRCANYA